MKFLAAILGIGFLLGMSIGVENAFSEQLLEANPTSLTYSIYQNPAISGTLTDENGTPISDVYVYAIFSNGTAQDWTDKNGKFFLRSSEKYPAGEHSVEVYARSDSFLSRIVVSFNVEEPVLPEPTVEPQLTKAKRGLSIQEMINQVRAHNIAEQQNTTMVQENNTQSLETQRQFAQMSLESDLQENSREYYKEKNRNSFAGFLSTIDVLMHAIFWEQFDFTQNISDEAYEAKNSALKEGKTSVEATKVYQETAAVTQSEVIDHIEKLNIKHGFANASSQEQFDENGKWTGRYTTETSNNTTKD